MPRLAESGLARFRLLKDSSLGTLVPPGRDGKFLSDAVKDACIPHVGDGTPAGTYFWHQGDSVLYLKLAGGATKSVEIRTEPVVQVSAKLDMSFTDFYEDRYVASSPPSLHLSLSLSLSLFRYSL